MPESSPREFEMSQIERELAELAGFAGAGPRDIDLPPDSSPEAAGTILRHRVAKCRDLTLVRLAGPYYMVIACDSDGGIGPKPHDTVKVPGYLVGRFAARVPLMEMLASGARPLVIVDALSVELEPTGREIIEGVRFEASLAGIEGDGAVTGSTEDNVPTVATGVGVTVIGLAEERRLRPGTGLPGDIVAAVGIPKSAPGDAVTVDDPEIADVPTVMKLARLAQVHDILPVGSKGIEYEARQMAASAGLSLVMTPDPGLNTKKSAGPSTCVLVSVAASRGGYAQMNADMDTDAHAEAEAEAEAEEADAERAALREIARAVGKPVALVGRLVRT